MWIEKYRPKRLDEIVGQEEVVKRIQGFITSKTIPNPPNLLLWSPKGTGKTSLVYALARELYGEFYEENLMHIETTDFIEGGRRWLKEKKTLKFFYDEQKSAIELFKEMIREYTALSPINAAFKLLFFSNADLLSRDAQQALRRVMEWSNQTCRFIFSTTKPAGLIPAIRSRCLNFHFSSLDKSGALELVVRSIAKEEGLKLTESGLKTLTDYANGDAGVAIMILEAAATLKKTIDRGGIEEALQHSSLQRKKVEELVDLVFEGRYRYKDMQALLESLIGEERRVGKEILMGIHEALRRKMKSARWKGKDVSRMFAQFFVYEGEADLKLCNSLNTIIHLEEMLMNMSISAMRWWV